MFGQTGTQKSSNFMPNLLVKEGLTSFSERGYPLLEKEVNLSQTSSSKRGYPLSPKATKH